MIPTAAILFRPVLPIALIVAIVVGVGVAAWYTYMSCSLSKRQRIGLWACRMGAVVIIGWLLLQAERRTVHHEREAPILAIAVDVSDSMTEKLVPDAPSRAEKALDFVTDGRVEKLCRRYRVVRYEVGSEVEEVTDVGADTLFNAPRSNIGSAVNDIVNRLRNDNLAGVILLSDGLDHSGENLLPEVLGTPIFVPELEPPIEVKTQTKPDTWIAEVSYPKMMVVNWKGTVDVIVRRRGKGKTSFPINFKQGGRALRTSMVDFEEGEQFKQVSFNVEPMEVGQILYQAEISPKEDSDAENNSRSFMIDVTDPKNRVLYLEGVPRWEFKFLKRALLSEKNYQLSAFVRGGDGNFINFSELSGMSGGTTPTFTADELRDYKVIILGDLDAEAFDEERCKNIRDFVDKGGGLLVVGAAKAYGAKGLHTAPYLKEVLPAASNPGARMTEGRFSADLTPTGRAHPATSGLPQDMRMPPILSFWAPVKVNELSSTLIATADGSPVLVIRRYGQGRAAMILSDSLWRWQMGGSDTGSEKTLYSSFITQLVYWLAPSEKEIEKTGILQVVTAKSEVELREKVTIGAVCDRGAEEGGEFTCRITTPDNQRLVFPMVSAMLAKDVGLGKRVPGYKCMFRPKTPGQYQVSVSNPDGTQEAGLMLLATKSEMERTGAPVDRNYLGRLAGDTGGQFVQWKSRYKMFKDIPCNAKEVNQVNEYPIWNRWWWLVILCILFCTEWWMRRQLDLV